MLILLGLEQKSVQSVIDPLNGRHRRVDEDLLEVPGLRSRGQELLECPEQSPIAAQRAW